MNLHTGPIAKQLSPRRERFSASAASGLFVKLNYQGAGMVVHLCYLSSPCHDVLYKFQLDKILDAQTLQSEQSGHRVHDEHLFIVVHQGEARHVGQSPSKIRSPNQEGFNVKYFRYLKGDVKKFQRHKGNQKHKKKCVIVP